VGPWIEFVHPDDIARTLALRAAPAEAGAVNFENRYRHRNGSYRWLAWSASRRIDGTAYLIARDVSEAKRTEAALRASEERLRDLFENAADINYTHDLTGRFTAVNRAIEAVAGYARDEILAMNVVDLVAPEHLELGRRRLAEVGIDRMAGTYEIALLAKDGHRVPVEVRTRLLLENGRPIGVQGTARDLSQRRAAERAQRRLIEILDATTDLVATCDASGRVLYYNRAGRRMLGIGEHENLAHLSAFDHMPRVERSRMAHGHPLVERDGVWSGDIAVRTRDGREIPVSAVILAHATRSGRIEAYSTIARDISEQQRVETELRAEAERSAALARVGSELLSSVATPVLLDHLTRLTAEALHCNASHIFLWDRDAQTYIAKSAHDDPEHWETLRVMRFPLSVVGPLQEPLDRGEMANVVCSQAPPRLQEEIFKPFDVLALLVVALRRGDEIIGVLTAINRTREAPFTAQQQRIIQGIAQLGSFALENARLFEELERANRFRSDFVATMSHELRTPMGVILGYHELLLDGTFGSLAPEQADTLRRANRNASELLDLVNATLDLSRLETRHIPLTLADLPVAALFDDVAAAITAPADRAGLRVCWHTPPDGLTIHTDPVKARMVLKNLVGNAVKFTERGRVTVAAQARNGGVELAVSDTGIGIAPDAQQLIFEPFRQVDGGSTRRYGGAGLGLYIVRRLLEALGGSIAVESALGHGATFRVWLPRQPGRAGPTA